MTETAGITHLNRRPSEEGTLDSVGPGLPGVDWRIADVTTGLEQPSYQPGEMYVRLPATGGSRGVPARWFPTGDAAFRDDHGRAYLLDRLSEGWPGPPAEPGAVLAAHPAVRDAVVVPVPDPGLGLVPYAFAVLTDEAAGEEAQATLDLLAYVNGRVPPYRGVVAVHVVDLIPRWPGGQVARRALLRRAGLSGRYDPR
jgi:acyl-coenzyme A synthetase/AMP-(fatty) acid ligase